MRLCLIRRFLVVVVALHSMVLGIALMARPVRVLELSGWEYAGPAFFPRQSGVFLLILGMTYAVGVWRRPFAWVIVLSKAAAVIFLVGEYVAEEPSQQLLLAGGIDGLMGLAIAAILVCEMRAERRLAAGRACPK